MVNIYRLSSWAIYFTMLGGSMPKLMKYSSGHLSLIEKLSAFRFYPSCLVSSWLLTHPVWVCVKDACPWRACRWNHGSPVNISWGWPWPFQKVWASCWADCLSQSYCTCWQAYFPYQQHYIHFTIPFTIHTCPTVKARCVCHLFTIQLDYFNTWTAIYIMTLDIWFVHETRKF